MNILESMYTVFVLKVVYVLGVSGKFAPSLDS